MLFGVWEVLPHRPTRDLDLLGNGPNDPEIVLEVLAEVLETPVEPDGLVFVRDALGTEPLHEGQDYEGLQVSLVAQLGAARIPLRVDIAFGQSVRPEAIEEVYPSLLGLPSPRLLTYPREVVVAEKFQAMVTLGMTNNRMKDFFDLAYLARRFEFESTRVAEAIRSTFNTRGTPVPDSPPLALTDEYFEASDRRRDWDNFRRRSSLEGEPVTLGEACRLIARFLLPVCRWVRAGHVPPGRWTHTTGWSE